MNRYSQCIIRFYKANSKHGGVTEFSSYNVAMVGRTTLDSCWVTGLNSIVDWVYLMSKRCNEFVLNVFVRDFLWIFPDKRGLQSSPMAYFRCCTREMKYMARCKKWCKNRRRGRELRRAKGAGLLIKRRRRPRQKHCHSAATKHSSDRAGSPRRSCAGNLANSGPAGHIYAL
ncbi:hypothetical protein J6590_005716 [Homalodisca vitripennis]|nr:hypothetical protein J6590_005716 [Homalodisca vitripennis]